MEQDNQSLETQNLETQNLEVQNQNNDNDAYQAKDAFYIVAYAPIQGNENPYEAFVTQTQEELGITNSEFSHLFAYTTEQIYDRSGKFANDESKIDSMYNYLKDNYTGHLKVFKFDSGILTRNFGEFIKKMNLPEYPNMPQYNIEPIDMSNEYPLLDDKFYGQQYATSYIFSEVFTPKVVKPLLKKQIPKEKILSEFLDNGTIHTSKPVLAYSSQSIMRLFPKEVARYFMFPGAAANWLEVLANKYKKDIEILEWDNSENAKTQEEPTPIYKGDPYKEAGYTLTQIFINKP